MSSRSAAVMRQYLNAKCHSSAWRAANRPDSTLDHETGRLSNPMTFYQGKCSAEIGLSLHQCDFDFDFISPQFGVSGLEFQAFNQECASRNERVSEFQKDP